MRAFQVVAKRGRLVVKELSHRDYGVYQCEVTNEAGSSMNTVWVKEGTSRNSGTLLFVIAKSYGKCWVVNILHS